MRFFGFYSRKKLSVFWHIGLMIIFVAILISSRAESAESAENKIGTYTVLKDFLPAAIAFFGLGGIALTAHLNLWTNRQLEKDRRNADAKALAITLLSEITGLRRNLVRRQVLSKHAYKNSKERLLEEDELSELIPPKFPIYRERMRTAVTNWSTVAAGFSQLRAG